MFWVGGSDILCICIMESFVMESFGLMNFEEDAHFCADFLGPFSHRALRSKKQFSPDRKFLSRLKMYNLD